MSSPAPALITSFPSPPQMRSSPSSPSIRSLPPSPAMTSAPPVPISTSSPSVPTIVASKPSHSAFVCAAAGPTNTVVTITTPAATDHQSGRLNPKPPRTRRDPCLTISSPNQPAICSSGAKVSLRSSAGTRRKRDGRQPLGTGRPPKTQPSRPSGPPGLAPTTLPSAGKAGALPR